MIPEKVALSILALRIALDLKRVQLTFEDLQVFSVVVVVSAIYDMN